MQALGNVSLVCGCIVEVVGGLNCVVQFADLNCIVGVLDSCTDLANTATCCNLARYITCLLGEGVLHLAIGNTCNLVG